MLSFSILGWPGCHAPAACQPALSLQPRLACRAWLVWGAIQCAALLAERGLQARAPRWIGRVHPHLRTAVVQCATQSTLLVQLPLGPSLPRFLACFHAVNLPFCALNAARLAGHSRAGGKLVQLRRPASKVAWD